MKKLNAKRFWVDGAKLETCGIYTPRQLSYLYRHNKEELAEIRKLLDHGNTVRRKTSVEEVIIRTYMN